MDNDADTVGERSADGEGSRVLLLIDAAGDRRVVSTWLSESHVIVTPPVGDELSVEFDLCILDDAAYLRLWRRIASRKRSAEPVFLPFMLLTSARSTPIVSEVPTHDVDEVLQAPVAREVFLSRIEALLDRRVRERVLAAQRQQALEAERSARQQAAQELEAVNLLLEASELLSASLDVDTLLEALVDVIQRFTGRPRVVVGFYDETRGLVRLRKARNAIRFREGDEFVLDEMPSHYRWAIRERETVIFDSDYASEIDRRLAHDDELRMALTVPLLVGDHPLGFLSLDTPGQHLPLAPREIRLAEAVAAQASIAIQNAQQLEERSRQAKYAAALNRINRAVHSTLELDTTIERAVREMADALEVDASALVSRHGNRWEFSHSHGLPPELAALRLDDEQGCLLQAVLKSECPVVVEDAAHDDREIVANIMALGITSMIAVPLVVRGAARGVLLAGSLRGMRRFADEEVDFARRVADTLALAAENARLYETERHIADRLQSALLELPAEVGGLEFSHAYHSATETARVGGDFYDLFELNDNHVGVLVGDVAGKGLNAAVLTSMVKNTIRAHANEEGKTPARILDLTNDVIFKATPTEAFVTVLFGILDRRDGRLVYANGGHTTGALLRTNGGLAELAVTGPILGAFMDAHYGQAETRLGIGELLFLYTDGLTEARRNGELYGEERLFDFLRLQRDVPAGELVRAVIAEVMSFAGERLRDDLALLALRRMERRDSHSR